MNCAGQLLCVAQPALGQSGYVTRCFGQITYSQMYLPLVVDSVLDPTEEFSFVPRWISAMQQDKT